MISDFVFAISELLGLLINLSLKSQIRTEKSEIANPKSQIRNPI